MATARENVLNYLKNPPGILVGQFGSFGDDTNYQTAQEQLDNVKQKSGYFPAMTGMDYAMPAGIAEANRYLIDKWNQGYIVNLSWHMPNPFNSEPATKSNAETFYDLAKLTTESTAQNAKFRIMLDTLAAGLKTLQDAGVVVLLRPFHELNGGWFWWTPAEGKEASFKALWVYTHNYLTKTKGLTNLIWCFSPNALWDQWSAKRPPSKYYPGDPYVDLIGFDKYANVGEVPLKLNAYKEYDDMAALNKPMYLFEFGPTPADSSGWEASGFNWNDFLNTLAQQYPLIKGFQAWEWIWQIGSDKFVGQTQMANNSKSIMLNDLPNFRTGTPPPDPDPDPEPEPEPEPEPVTDLTPVLERLDAIEAKIDRTLAAAEAVREALTRIKNAL